MVLLVVHCDARQGWTIWTGEVMVMVSSIYNIFTQYIRTSQDQIHFT